MATVRMEDMTTQIIDAVDRSMRPKLEEVTARDFHGTLVISLHIQAGVLNHVKVSTDRVLKIVAGRLQ